METVNLSADPRQIDAAERAGVQTVPALALDGQVFHINFGADLATVRQLAGGECRGPVAALRPGRAAGAGSTLAGALLLAVLYNAFNLEGSIGSAWQWVPRGKLLVAVQNRLGRG